MAAPNVECTRCGYRWYAEQYDEREILPHYCTRCYRQDVQPIPEEPGVVGKAVHEIETEAERVPDIIQEERERFILWKENNRYMLELAGLVFGLGIIMAVLFVFIFYWG